jgi:hypothetical protein
MINAVLTMAPEFGEDAVTLPLNAILDWTMGTPAGFAAYRDPRINAMLKKILNAWCEFLSSADSLYVLKGSPSGWKCEAAKRTVASRSSCTIRQTNIGASSRGMTSSPDVSSIAHVRSPPLRTTK